MLRETKLLKFNKKRWFTNLQFYIGNNHYINNKYYINNKKLVKLSYFFNTFKSVYSSNSFLKHNQNLNYYKFDLIGFYLINKSTKFSNTYYILSIIHKVFFKKGFMVKIVKLVNNSLKQINDFFFNECFSYYNNNTNLSFSNIDRDVTEVYSYKYFNNINKDVFLINDNSFSDNYPITIEYQQVLDNILNNGDKSDELLFSDCNTDFNYPNISIFLLNIFFKYSFFFSITNFYNLFKFKNNFKFSSHNFLYSLYSKNYFSLSISFFNKYFFLLFSNVKRLYSEDYLKLSNNFLSIFYFIPKIINKVYFFFKVQLSSLSKRVRKILKNKRKFMISYTYIKPNRRLHTTIHHLKKYLFIADGRTLQDKIFNVFFSTLNNSKSSWVSSIYNKHQIDCLSKIKYSKK